LLGHEQRIVPCSTPGIQNPARLELTCESTEILAPDKVTWVGETEQSEVRSLECSEICSKKAGASKLGHDILSEQANSVETGNMKG
jgi:hypothetical protein